MRKLLSCLIAVMVLFTGTGTLAFANNISQIIGDGNTVIFIDVPQNYWARSEIESFYNQNLVSGVGNDKFAPDDGVTREQFARMLVTTFNAPMTTPSEPTFSDIPADRWSYPYIETCKDYLTAYANPFGGKPTFRGEEFATREDITVALVRMMGFTDNDVTDKNYASRTFSDAAAISPNLLGYVSLAAQKGLISGYPDGSFGPTRGITRAEAVVLLSRATKQSVSTIEADLALSASVVSSPSNPAQITVMITTEQGATVTVDGTNVPTANNGAGGYQGSYPHTFSAEGSKTFIITATKAGKTRTIEVVGSYSVGAPVLTILNCPATSSSKSVSVSGTLTNGSGSKTVLTINGKEVYVSYNGSWSSNVDLTEGNNTLEFVATSDSGKVTRETRTVTFGVGGPTLNITYCPTSYDEKSVTIKGTVKDANDSRPTVTVNNKEAYVSYDGSWSYNVDLQEGTNTLNIQATNNLGKVTSETRSITFNVGGPNLRVTECPETSSNKTINIRGTVSDTNDRQPTVTVNGENAYVSYDGSWSLTYTLNEGANKIRIVATNSLGKTTELTRDVDFTVSGPNLRISYCPATYDEQRVTIRGTVTDANDNRPVVTVNNKEAYVSYDGSWSYNYTLSEGSNTIIIQASSSTGKTTEETRTIEYTPN